MKRSTKIKLAMLPATIGLYLLVERVLFNSPFSWGSVITALFLWGLFALIFKIPEPKEKKA